MSEAITLHAEPRSLRGKGASRRLRRIEGKVPAIVYGGSKDPVQVTLAHNKLIKLMENEAFYSSLLNLEVAGKSETVIVKDIQRHPYKAQIMHLDLQRVSSKEVINKAVPLHFTNEENCDGVKMGGAISHMMNEVEIKCKAADLPEFIEVDMTHVSLGTTLHLSDIKLPKGAELTVDIADGTHDLPVASVQTAKGGDDEEEVSAQAEGDEQASDA